MDVLARMRVILVTRKSVQYFSLNLMSFGSESKDENWQCFPIIDTCVV